MSRRDMPQHVTAWMAQCPCVCVGKEGRKEKVNDNTSLRESRILTSFQHSCTLHACAHGGCAALSFAMAQVPGIQEEKNEAILFHTMSRISHTLFFSISREILRPSVLACLQSQKKHVNDRRGKESKNHSILVSRGELRLLIAIILVVLLKCRLR